MVCVWCVSGDDKVNWVASTGVSCCCVVANPFSPFPSESQSQLVFASLCFDYGCVDECTDDAVCAGDHACALDCWRPEAVGPRGPKNLKSPCVELVEVGVEEVVTVGAASEWGDVPDAGVGCCGCACVVEGNVPCKRWCSAKSSSTVALSVTNDPELVPDWVSELPRRDEVSVVSDGVDFCSEVLCEDLFADSSIRARTF